MKEKAAAKPSQTSDEPNPLSEDRRRRKTDVPAALTDALAAQEKDAKDDEIILVALVDDNRISRDAHTKLLNAEPGVRVISAEATLSVTMLTDSRPDVVLVDASHDEMISLKAALTTRKVLPDAGVVITDLDTDNGGVAKYVKAGVAGFALQDANSEDLVDTVKEVADGSHVLPEELTSPLFVQIAAEGIEIDMETDGEPVRARIKVNLTVREQEIIGLMREGLANKAIAARLLISTHTVKSHVRSAMEKTGLRTRVLLAMSPIGKE